MRRDEYVLIGDLGDTDSQAEGCAYSLSYEHPGYERVLLERVSAEMLTVYDAKRISTRPGQGTSCAVAYRRIQRAGEPLSRGPQQPTRGREEEDLPAAHLPSTDPDEESDDCMLQDASGAPIRLVAQEPARQGSACHSGAAEEVRRDDASTRVAAEQGGDGEEEDSQDELILEDNPRHPATTPAARPDARPGARPDRQSPASKANVSRPPPPPLPPSPAVPAPKAAPKAAAAAKAAFKPAPSASRSKAPLPRVGQPRPKCKFGIACQIIADLEHSARFEHPCFWIDGKIRRPRDKAHPCTDTSADHLFRFCHNVAGSHVAQIEDLDSEINSDTDGEIEGDLISRDEVGDVDGGEWEVMDAEEEMPWTPPPRVRTSGTRTYVQASGT